MHIRGLIGIIALNQIVVWLLIAINCAYAYETNTTAAIAIMLAAGPVSLVGTIAGIAITLKKHNQRIDIDLC